MIFSCEKDAILAVLNNTSRIVEKRNTIPILSNIMLEADGDQIIVTATDLDIEYRQSFKAEVEIGGSITVPAILMNDIVRKLDGKKPMAFKLDQDGANAKISQGRSSFKIHCLPTSDFPSFSANPSNCRFDIKSADLSKIFGKTQFAISTEETRYYLNGVYFHTVMSEDNRQVIRGTATDGHRLAYHSVEMPEGAGGMPGVIVPRKTVDIILRLCDLDKETSIEVSDTRVIFTIGGVRLASKLIDGTFPDYHRVVPKSNSKVAKCDIKTLAQSVDRVATVSSERGRAVKLTFANHSLELLVSNPDSGNAMDQVDIEYASDPLSIGFNAKYLLDITSQISGSMATLKMEDPGAPVVITADGDTDTLFVLMPMRV